MSYKVLTSGVDSEYVLAPLAAYLRQQGFDVVELDFGREKGDVTEALKLLSSTKVAYLTSAHTNFSVRMARALLPSFARAYPNYLCPLEVIPMLGSNVTSIYVPHDLLTPYGDANLGELRFLNIFDHILAPDSSKALKATIGGATMVHDCGWIKYNSQLAIKDAVAPMSKPPIVSVFISMIEHLRHKYGIQGFVDYIKPIMRDGYSIKLPAWHGVAEIEALLQSQGINVVSSEVSSIELILQSDIVICNGASSIHAEASYLGKATICMLADEGISPGEQKRKLGAIEGVSFMTRDQLCTISVQELASLVEGKANPKKGKIFDFGFVADLVAASFR